MDLRVAVFGGTGLAGVGVVRAWLDEPRVVEVRSIARRRLPLQEPRLVERPWEDFLDVESLAKALADVDAVCFCLGISASRPRARTSTGGSPTTSRSQPGARPRRRAPTRSSTSSAAPGPASGAG